MKTSRVLTVMIVVAGIGSVAMPAWPAYGDAAAQQVKKHKCDSSKIKVYLQKNRVKPHKLGYRVIFGCVVRVRKA